MSVKALVAGNWKMNGLSASLVEFEAMKTAYDDQLASKVDLMICPPATLLSAMAQASDAIAVGAQDCHAKESGAHTGDVSADMIADCGARAVIVGHSERRADHGETSQHVREKAQAAHRVGLTAIVCVGETQQEREGGKAISVVLEQVASSLPGHSKAGNTVVAYEPVWAIGTGLTPTTADVEEMHTAIRTALVERFGEDGNAIRILYGGSVKPANAAELMAVKNVNGALVGGASLKASDFIGIASVYA